MSEDVNGLKTKLRLAEGLYLVLFLSSLVMIVEHTVGSIWALTLGSAVLIRVMITQPLRAKYQEALTQKARVEDRLIVTEQVEASVRERLTT